MSETHDMDANDYKRTLPPNLGCPLPPEGWWCSREPGHEGPCAARPAMPASAPKPLSSRWQELFWALPPGEMRSKLRSLEIDMGRALREVSPPAVAPASEVLAEMRAYEHKYAGTVMGLACGRAAARIAELENMLYGRDDVKL